VFAMPKTPAGQGWRTHHREIPSTVHAKVAGHRSPYEGEWGYGSRRRGPSPTVPIRGATLRNRQSGRCAYCGQYFQHDDPLEVDHRNGDRRNSRYSTLQALHGQCHDAKTREHSEHLPVGVRDKHRHTEERRDRKRSCAVLEQREAERSASRL
jgi:5-methylcytosine-specific restriction endonuclease McrA